MGFQEWIAEHWFDLLQTVGIVGSLIFAAYTTRKDEKARRVGNLIAMNDRYGTIWQELYDRPALSRILKKDVNLSKNPVSEEELLFVKMLVFHLQTVHQAIKDGIFVKVEGIREDIRRFFAAPIPRFAWQAIKPFQNTDFVEFIEESLGATASAFQ